MTYDVEKNSITLLKNKNKVLFVALIVLISIGAVYRNATSPFWLDEMFTGSLNCQPSFISMLSFNKYNLHPILYQIIVYTIFSNFGCNLWLIRGLSLIFSLSGACLLFSSVRKLKGDISLLFAFTLGNPTFWFYSFEARSYGLLFFCGCGVIYYTLSHDKYHSAKALLCTLTGAMLHYYASYLFLVVLVITAVFDKETFRSKQFRILFFLAFTTLIAYYSMQMQNAISSGHGFVWVPKPSLFQLIGFIGNMLGNIPSSFPIIVLATVILFLPHKHSIFYPTSGLLMLLLHLSFIIVLLFISLLKPTMVYRYSHFMFPLFVIGFTLIFRDVILEYTSAKSALNNFKFLMLNLYLFLNLIFLISFPADRWMNWLGAMASMDCTQSMPCGFVLDDSTLLNTNKEQYEALSNFLAPQPDSYVAIQPEFMTQWIQDNPGKSLLYIRFFSSSLPFPEIAKTFHLVCDEHYLAKNVAIPCRIPPADPSR